MMEEKGIDVGPVELDKFSIAFLDRFCPFKLRETIVHEFINLKQGNMSVKEHSLKFTQLVRYDLNMMADSRFQMSEFVSRVLKR